MDEKKDLTAQMVEDAEKGLPSNDEIKKVADLAQRQLSLEQEIVLLEERAAVVQKELTEICDRQLPDLLLQLGVREIKLASGKKVVIQRLVFASIAKKREAEAFSWLQDNGFKDIIKLEFAGKIDNPEAAATVVMLAKERGVDITQKASVHSSTLKAFVTEQLAERPGFPRELFGVYEVNRSKLS